MNIKPKKLIAVGVAGAAVTALGLVTEAPAHAAIANPSLVMSNNQSASSSTYTYTFTPGLNLTQVLTGVDTVVGIPGGASALAGGNVSVYENSGSGWGSALSGVTTSINSATGGLVGIQIPSSDFTGLTSVPQLKVVVSDLTNPTVSVSTTAYGCVADVLSTVSGFAGDITGGTFTSTATTGTFSSTLTSALSDVACLASSIVPVGTNGVSEQLNVAPVLNVSLPSTADSFSITPTATGVSVNFPVDDVTVATNAQSYIVEGAVSGSSSALGWDEGSGHSLPITAAASQSPSPSCSGSQSLGVNGSGNQLGSTVPGLTDSKVTYVTYCGNNIDLTSPAGTYSGVITYMVVPSF